MTRSHRLPTAIARLLLCVTILAATVPALAGETTSDYKKSIEEWHRGRIARLTAPDGYLSLVGLFPLEEGANRFGSAESNSMVFPEKAPKRMGTIYLKDGKLEVAIMPGVSVTHDGEPVDKMRIESDAEGEPTVLESGTFSFYVIDRAGELYLRVKDSESEALKNFGTIERFPVDEKWRIEATFEPYDPPKPIHVPNVLGYEFTEQCPGAIVFEVGGETYRLEPMSRSGDEYFVVFGDETSGLETYGGGRFVYVPVEDENGKLVIDFNKAYNPPCAFTPHATCPLPHKENILPLRIEAGEKAYGDAHAHHG